MDGNFYLYRQLFSCIFQNICVTITLVWCCGSGCCRAYLRINHWVSMWCLIYHCILSIIIIIIWLAGSYPHLLHFLSLSIIIIIIIKLSSFAFIYHYTNLSSIMVWWELPSLTPFYKLSIIFNYHYCITYLILLFINFI